ncbi:hypothetical protein G9444_4045 [Rhodococcus erythropolis]|uniref:AB hydrolase-1 domain-containing protein n=1 Tax=Rhodococcus erythropolis TaxID=1833 RepID=A0A6G9CWL3_RHOER|nr:hypothetical protein G9444_4045 [Rhodococcus erythropolis]
MSSTSTYEIPVGDLTFDVLISGPDDGIPLVALHGFPESAASWGKVTPLLTAAGYRVIAPNQRGYSAGARPEGVDAYKIEHLVADVVGLLDALGPVRRASGRPRLGFGGRLAGRRSPSEPDPQSDRDLGPPPHRLRLGTPRGRGPKTTLVVHRTSPTGGQSRGSVVGGQLSPAARYVRRPDRS